jgi:hypothetical protein
MRRFALVACLLDVACFSEADVMGTESDGATGCTLPEGCDSSGSAATTEPGSSTSSAMPGTSDDDAGSTAAPEDSTGTPADDTSGSEGDASTGPEAICGDGTVDPAEMCDGTPGCLGDCTFESYDCNPLGNAGCGGGLRCGAFDVPLEDFSCMVPGRGVVGDPCEGDPGNDSQCGDGLTCLFNINTPLCDNGNCCVEYCNLLDADFVCSGGAECRPFFPDPMFLGLEHLGFCGESL